MIAHCKVVVLQELQPTPLPQVQVLLGKDILKALMISEHLELLAIQIVPPDLKGINNSCQLKIMGRIIELMVLQLTGCISYYLPMLHKHTAQAKQRSICIYDEST